MGIGFGCLGDAHVKDPQFSEDPELGGGVNSNVDSIRARVEDGEASPQGHT